MTQREAILAQDETNDTELWKIRICKSLKSNCCSCINFGNFNFSYIVSILSSVVINDA